jgi:hypothetical protein
MPPHLSTSASFTGISHIPALLLWLSVVTLSPHTNTEREGRCPRHNNEKSRQADSPDDDTLVLPVDHHVSVHVVCQGVDVRRVLILGLEVQQRS